MVSSWDEIREDDERLLAEVPQQLAELRAARWHEADLTAHGDVQLHDRRLIIEVPRHKTL
jgi:hypothetical protein